MPELLTFVVDASGVSVTRNDWLQKHNQAWVVATDHLNRPCTGPAESAHRDDALRVLYKAFIVPVERAIRGKSRLMIACTGELARTPFSALLNRLGVPLAQDKELTFLGTSYDLVHLPRRRAVRRIHTAVLLRGSDLDQAGLAGADVELRFVCQVLASHGIRANDVAESAEPLDAIQQAEIIHFAGHGRFDGAAGGTLSLAGGSITADDLLGLKLRRRPMVVLATCESGVMLPFGDELNGFVMAFLVAGARAVVCSTSEVRDDATLFLMSHFYEALLGEHLEPGAAMARAQRAIRARLPDPFFWSSFRVFGAA